MENELKSKWKKKENNEILKLVIKLHVNLKSFANTEGDEGFGAQILKGDGNIGRNVSNSSKWLEYSHSRSFISHLHFQKNFSKLVTKSVTMLYFKTKHTYNIESL